MTQPAGTSRLFRCLRRWKFWVVLGALLVFVPYLSSRIMAPYRSVRLIEIEPGFAATPPSDSPFRLRIMAYNIAHGRGLSDSNWTESGAFHQSQVSKIADLVGEFSPDVLILNEVDFSTLWSGHQNQAASIAEKNGFQFRVEQRNLDFGFVFGCFRFGNAVLSKHPIVDIQPLDYPALHRWESLCAGKKRGVRVAIQIKTAHASKVINVVPIHLEHRSEHIRVESVKFILDQTRDNHPLVLAGDFNSTPDGFPKSKKNHKGENAMDWLVATSKFRIPPHDSPELMERTHPSDEPQQVIDWILTSVDNDLVVSHYKVIDSQLSDHRAVLTDLLVFDRGAD